MNLRSSLAPSLLALLAAAPAFAQPAKPAPAPTTKPAAPTTTKPAAPTPAAPPATARRPAPPAATPAAKPTTDDLAEFDRDLDALFAQGGLTADQAASRAGAASPTVRRRLAEIEASVAQVDAARLAYVPQISGKLSYTRLSKIDPVVIPVGGQEFRIESFPNAYLAEGQVVVPLSDYVLRFPKLIDAAKLGADAAQLNKRASEVSAGQDARLAFYEWVRAKLQVLISKRQLLQVQKTLDQVRALAEVQRLSKADLLRVESQEAEAEQVVDQLENLAVLREEQLRLLIGAGNEPLAIGEDIRTEIQAAQAGELDASMSTATKQRLEFRAIDAGIAAKESQRSAELANLLPRLSAFGVADYANPNQRAFPATDEFKFTWSLGAQLTWTLNDALVSRTTERRLIAEAKQLEADRESLARGTRIEVLSAQQSVAIAQRALITSQKGLASAEEGYRVRKELLNAERATAVELVDAETELTRSRIAALNARVDLRVARAQLEHALGNDTK